MVPEERINAVGDVAGLRELVRKHRAYLEVEPRVVEADGRKVRVGADLRLWGAHRRASSPRPSCTLCKAIHQDLFAIASFTLPPAGGRPAVSILPFDGRLFASDRWGRDEVDLTIRIGDAADPSGLAQADLLLREIRLRLEFLGVFLGGWRPSDY